MCMCEYRRASWVLIAVQVPFNLGTSLPQLNSNPAAEGVFTHPVLPDACPLTQSFAVDSIALSFKPESIHCLSRLILSLSFTRHLIHSLNSFLAFWKSTHWSPVSHGPKSNSYLRSNVWETSGIRKASLKWIWRVYRALYSFSLTSSLYLNIWSKRKKCTNKIFDRRKSVTQAQEQRFRYSLNLVRLSEMRERISNVTHRRRGNSCAVSRLTRKWLGNGKMKMQIPCSPSIWMKRWRDGELLHLHLLLPLFLSLSPSDEAWTVGPSESLIILFLDEKRSLAEFETWNGMSKGLLRPLEWLQSKFEPVCLSFHSWSRCVT